MPAEALTAGGTFRSSSVSSRAVLRGSGPVAGLTLFWLTFRAVDVRHVTALIHGLGTSAALLVLPSMAALALETTAWRNAFVLIGARPTFWSLARVRVASESVGVILPLGAVWSEALKPPLLGRQCGTPVSVNLVAVAARKYLLLVSQAGYLLLGFALGQTVLRSGFARLGGTRDVRRRPSPRCARDSLSSRKAWRPSLRGGQAIRVLFRLASAVPSERWRALLVRCERRDRSLLRHGRLLLRRSAAHAGEPRSPLSRRVALRSHGELAHIAFPRLDAVLGRRPRRRSARDAAAQRARVPAGRTRSAGTGLRDAPRRRVRRHERVRGVHGAEARPGAVVGRARGAAPDGRVDSRTTLVERIFANGDAQLLLSDAFRSTVPGFDPTIRIVTTSTMFRMVHLRLLSPSRSRRTSIFHEEIAIRNCGSCVRHAHGAHGCRDLHSRGRSFRSERAFRSSLRDARRTRPM